jgi:hypothetical protein
MGTRNSKSTLLKIAAWAPVLTVPLAGGLAGPAGAADAPARAKAAPGLTADRFDSLRALIKPRPGGYADIPWMTDLWEARKKAAAEGKPLLVWVGDGHPLGWT